MGLIPTRLAFLIMAHQAPQSLVSYTCPSVCLSSGGSKRAPETPPWGSKFFHFHVIFGQRNRLAHPLWELAPPTPSPRKILDPPLLSIHLSSVCLILTYQAQHSRFGDMDISSIQYLFKISVKLTWQLKWEKHVPDVYLFTFNSRRQDASSVTMCLLCSVCSIYLFTCQIHCYNGFFSKCFTEFSDKNICHYSKRAWTCHLLFKRPPCYNSASKTHNMLRQDL